MAQQPPEATAPPPAPAAAVSSMTVTGSRIVNPETKYSNPVVSVDEKSIEYSGITNVTDLLKQLPALVGSQDSNDSAGSSENNFIGATGLNLLNLRNLGFDRTLVLVNGRRHVSSLAGSAAIDTNAIPTDLIERIDISTGGASAIYGADGVSGVVNFIMKDNFEGMRVRSQFTQPEEGGNKQGFMSVVGGMNFAEGRGNAALGLEFSREGRLEGRNRPNSGSRETRFVVNPNDPGDDPNTPDRIPMRGLGWFESGRGGAVYTDEDDILALLGDPGAVLAANFDGNTDAAWNEGNFPNGIQGRTYAQGGSATPTAGYGGDLLPRETRIATNFFGHYDLATNARLFTELKYVNTKSLSYGQPTFDFYVYVNGDNPFLPPNIAAAAASGDVLVSRDNFDFGLRGEDIERETSRAAIGLEGALASWVDYNVSAVYGETDVRLLIRNNRYNDRYAAALDAVAGPGGQPVCRSNLDPNAEAPNVGWQGWASPTSFTPGADSGCVPINIFGEGSPSQAAIDWIMVDSRQRDRVAQKVATAYLTGNLDPWFKAPGGSFGFAFGAEWRREDATSTPSLEDRQGITFGNKVDPSRGAYEVSEGFVEINVPLLKDRRFAKTLSIDAAERYSHYTTIGDTSTWKVGAQWAPIDDVAFRATRARAVRAPNISELFGPAGQTFLFIDDPCDVSQVGLGTQYRAANCAAILTAAGADPNTFTDVNAGFSVPGILKGNANLEEEAADTNTIGIILQPRFAKGLVFTLDYYDIDLTNAINTLDPEEIAQQCVDLPTIDNQFCGLITRVVGGTDAGGISDYTIQPVNVARFRTKGYDFSLAYSLDPSRWGKQDWGIFRGRLIGSYLKDLFFVNLPGADPDPDLGEEGAPRQQMSLDLTWERGPLLFNYGVTYFSRTQRYNLAERAAQPDIVDPKYFYFNALLTQDLQARYTLRDNVTLYAGVNNLTNQQPDVGRDFYPVSAVGRTWYAGVTFNGF